MPQYGDVVRLIERNVTDGDPEYQEVYQASTALAEMALWYNCVQARFGPKKAQEDKVEQVEDKDSEEKEDTEKEEDKQEKEKDTNVTCQQDKTTEVLSSISGAEAVTRGKVIILF